MRNCLNCGAPFDVDKERCEYCGTSYYDMSAINIDGKTPFMLKLKVDMNGYPCYITQLVVAKPDMSIEFASETTDVVDCRGSVVSSIYTNCSCTTNISFQAVQRKSGELVSVVYG